MNRKEVVETIRKELESCAGNYHSLLKAQDNDDFHLVPIGEDDHITDGSSCWCQALEMYKSFDDGKPDHVVFLHNLKKDLPLGNN